MFIVFKGNARYPSLASDKWQFDDCCEDCRLNIRRAVESALPPFAFGQSLGKEPDIAVPVARPPAIIDSEFPEVGEKEDDQPF